MSAGMSSEVNNLIQKYHQLTQNIFGKFHFLPANCKGVNGEQSYQNKTIKKYISEPI